MPTSPRPWADGRSRTPVSQFRDADHPRPFRDTPSPRYDQDRFIGGERDRMLPKTEFSAARIPVQSSRRWRLIGFLSGLTVLVIMALLVTLPTNQAEVAELLDFALPPPSAPYDDSQFSGIATALRPAATMRLEYSPENTSMDEIRKAIVMASYKNQNVDWLQNLPKYTKGWEIFRYIGDDPNTELLSVPTENGREAMAFLTFIIDNYNDLPDYAVFTHGHDRAWHQPQHTIDKLMALNLTAVAAENYVNLRCSESPGCTDDTKFSFDPRNSNDHRPGMIIEEGFWQHLMADEFGSLPPVFARRCCAQFAVSKHAIQFRSHDFWKSLRRPLEGTMADIKDMWGPNVDRYRLGSLYEQIWHILFGKDPEFCPSKEYCEAVHFSGAIHCDGETTSYKDNKDNWSQITCTNDLRTAVDSAAPLGSNITDTSAEPQQGPYEETATGNDVLPSQQDDAEPAAPL